MQNIYEISKNKTKIFIFEDKDDNFVLKLTKHVANFLGKEIDFMNFEERKTFTESDFIIFNFNEENLELLSLRPNIFVIAKNSENPFIIEKITENITSGGVLIFDENDLGISKILETTKNYFKRISFKTPEFSSIENQIFLKTELGEIPLNISKNNLKKLEASRLLCQQIGIQEEDFFEALLYFQF